MGRSATPPAEVNLIYRQVGKTHVFTALELPGFHIGSSRLSHVFNQAMPALNEHVSKLYHCKALYKFAPASFDEFRSQISGDSGQVNATITGKPVSFMHA